MVYLYEKIFAVALVTLMSPLKTAQDQDVTPVSVIGYFDPIVSYAFIKLQKYYGIVPNTLMEIVPGSVHGYESFSQGSNYSFQVRASNKTKTEICYVEIFLKPHSFTLSGERYACH